MSNAQSRTLLNAPSLSWSEDGLPIAQAFDDPYFSLKSGLDESRYVFLQHNGLPNRWSSWPWHSQANFCIIETGFGTGLNFLATWQAWRTHIKTQPTTGWLHFTSIEKFPLTPAQLTQALSLWPELQELSDLLLKQYPLPLKGTHHLTWPSERISLTLYFDDVIDALTALNGPVHAWYLDGFSPAKNPDMWSNDLFAQIKRISLCHPNQYSGEHPASVATFTAASQVRRGLLGAGFLLQRDKGFGLKREMLSGVFQHALGPERPAVFTHKPWTLRTQQPVGNIVVIGAGLAGASTARALAERGFTITVLDESGIAQKASGNPQGGMYIKLAASDDAMHTDFYLAAYQYALTFMQRYLGDSQQNKHWQQCGVLQLAYDEKEQNRQKKFIESYPLPEELIRQISAEEASILAGCTQSHGGLFFPKAGWVSPADLCKTLLNHPNISVENTKIKQLTQTEDGWCIHASKHHYTAQHVILATAFDTKALIPNAYLPIKNIRGQLSFIQQTKAPPLNTVLCGRNYMAPAHNGFLCLGATYNLHEQETKLRVEDHQTNLNYLVDFGSDWQSLATQQGLNAVSGGRVGFRCTTPDYLPMAGAVPVSKSFAQSYAQLAKNSRQIPPVECKQYEGLWLNIGHGSRGLVSAPLCGELIAALISNDALPINSDMAEALWPGRFLLRDVIRRKITADKC